MDHWLLAVMYYFDDFFGLGPYYLETLLSLSLNACLFVFIGD